MEKKSGIANILIYLCVTFFVMALVFIYMSLRGKTQAGLIEVACSAALFVIFLHLIKKVLPESANIIASVLSILIAISFVYINLHLQRKKDKHYTVKELFVGDLLARKFFGNNKKPYKSPTKSFDDFELIEFARTTTEKYTIESSFEKPEEVYLGSKPISIPLDLPAKSTINMVKWQPFDIPRNNNIYELMLKGIEVEPIDKNRAKVVLIEDAVTGRALSPHLSKAISPPVGTETVQLNNVFDSQDKMQVLMPTMSSPQIPLEMSYRAKIGRQIKDKLIKP